MSDAPTNPAPPVTRTVSLSVAGLLRRCRGPRPPPRPPPAPGGGAGPGPPPAARLGHPSDVLDERRRVDVRPVVDDRRQHRVDELLAQQSRLEAQIEELRVARVVVMVLELLARVAAVLDR